MPFVNRKSYLTTVLLACASFGRFKPEFLLDLYGKIDQHLRESGRTTVSGPDTSAQLSADTTSDETVVMSNNLPGGLLRPNKSSDNDNVSLQCLDMQRCDWSFIHACPQQSRPIFKAPTARASLLGLDRLAQQKREAEAAKASESQKKIKIDYAADEDQDEEMAAEPTCKYISTLL